MAHHDDTPWGDSGLRPRCLEAEAVGCFDPDHVAAIRNHTTEAARITSAVTRAAMIR